MTEQLIPLERLKPNPEQVRRTFQRIEELAESIARHTLLQNLVVKSADADGFHEIVAGERRYRALTLLATEGRLPNRNIRCLVVPTDGVIENISENVMREDVPLWELGRKYVNLFDTGLTQAEIAARVGKTQGHVSTATKLARNLAPGVVVRLSTLPANTFPAQRLLRLATLLNDHDEPDEATQLRLFKEMLGTPNRRGKRAGQARTEKETVWSRYQRLRDGKTETTVDPVYRPFLTALLKYLAGETRGFL